MFLRRNEYIFEDGVKIPIFGKEISKELEVFYNPLMKLNRDISLVFIQTYFQKPIIFVDPMGASGIREIRFLKKIPEKFEEIIIGDISKIAIKNIKNNFKLNKISGKNLKNVKFLNQDAINTINDKFAHFIEIDPFGSPVPFLDIAAQKIKHNGILSVTATDTAPLCGTYSKTAMRKYGIKTQRTLWHEELGLRNLIAYVQRACAKYNKRAIPMVSFSKDHYFKVFFRIEESKTLCLKDIRNLKYLKSDKKSQDILVCDFETEETFGKTYIGTLCDKEFLEKLGKNLSLIDENKKATDLIEKLIGEIETLGHYNPHKLEKAFKFSSSMKFDRIIEDLKKEGFSASRPHNNRLGIKTTGKGQDIVRIMKNFCFEN